MIFHKTRHKRRHYSSHRKAHITENYVNLGWKHIDNGEYNDAMKAFDKAIYYRQNTFMALHGKGECLLELKEYDAALNCFIASINTNRKHPWAYHGAGRAYHFLKKYDIALAFYKKSISLEKRGIVAWHWMGRTLTEIGEYEEAEKSLTNALNNAIRGKQTGYRQNLIDRINNDLQKVRKEKEKRQHFKEKPQIIIHGNNNAPIAAGGILATGEAIINRPDIDNSITRNSTEYYAINHKRIDFHGNNQHKPKIIQLEQGVISKVLGMKKYVCSRCGAEVKEGQIFCNKCGSELK